MNSSHVYNPNQKKKGFHRRSQTQSNFTSQSQLNDIIDVNVNAHIDRMKLIRANKFNNLTTGYGLSRFSSVNPQMIKPHKRQTSGIMGVGFVKSKGNMTKVQNACFNLLIHQDTTQNQNKIRKMSMQFQNIKGHSRSASAFLKIRKQSQQKQQSNIKSKKVSFIMNGKCKLLQKEKQKSKFNSQKENDKKIEVIRQLRQKLKYCDFDLESWKLEIKKICKMMQQLRNFGIAEKKMNNWCRNYFESKKKGLIQIFMKRLPKKRSLNDEIIYIVVQNQDYMLTRIAQEALPMSDKERYFLGVELNLYRNFLQQKIANKHKLELNQIQDRVKSNVQQAQTKQLARQLYQVQNASTQVLTFFSDLQRLEQTYGKLNLVSLKNRKRFENINKSQLNIKKIIYE